MTKQESRRISKENEERFQAAQKHWQEYKDKSSWDILWFCVYLCCENLCKSKGKGIVIPDLESKAMDATIKVLSKIKDGVTVGKLSSYCYFPVIEQLYNKQLQCEDKELSYEAWLEYQYAEEEGRAN